LWPFALLFPSVGVSYPTGRVGCPFFCHFTLCSFRSFLPPPSHTLLRVAVFLSSSEPHPTPPGPPSEEVPAPDARYLCFSPSGSMHYNVNPSPKTFPLHWYSYVGGKNDWTSNSPTPRCCCEGLFSVSFSSFPHPHSVDYLRVRFSLTLLIFARMLFMFL